MARTYVLTLSTIVPVLRSECINTYNTRKLNTRVFNTELLENIRILRAQLATHGGLSHLNTYLIKKLGIKIKS
jgi:hypothetical protein